MKLTHDMLGNSTSIMTIIGNFMVVVVAILCNWSGSG